MNLPHQFKGFTERYPNPVREIITDAWLSPASLSESPEDSDFSFQKVRAIWDTGATSTVITPSLFEQLGLNEEGREQVHTAGGTKDAIVCYVAVALPNNLVFPLLRATVCDEMAGEGQMLIGMDIIGYGDFSFTFGRMHPVLCYMTPSNLHIDFGRTPMVYGDIASVESVPQVGRNDPCPCNSGFKFKQCHGFLVRPNRPITSV